MEALGGALGSVISLGCTYPLAIVGRIRSFKSGANWTSALLLSVWSTAPKPWCPRQVSTWQALEHQQGIELASPELRKKYAYLPSPFRELCIVSLLQCMGACGVAQVVSSCACRQTSLFGATTGSAWLSRCPLGVVAVA